jgi:hypothetical protein
VAWHTREFDFSPLRGDNGFGDAQAKSGAALLTGSRRINSVKAVEHSWQVLGWNPNTGVTEGNNGGPVFPF